MWSYNIIIMESTEIPVIEVADFMANNENADAECKKVVESLHRFGVLIIKDPRVSVVNNNEFLDLMERYFSTTGEKLYAGEKLEDERVEIHHQRGVTPPFAEKAMNHCSKFADVEEKNKPLS